MNKEQYIQEFLTDLKKQSEELKRALSNILYTNRNNEPDVKRVIDFYNFIENYTAQLELDNIELLTRIDKLNEDVATAKTFMGPNLSFFFEINQLTKKIITNEHTRN